VHGAGLEVAAERLAGGDRAGEVAGQSVERAGSAPPSVITYATRAFDREARMPARTAGSAECRSAVTTGMPSRDVAAAMTSRCGEASSSTPSRIACNGV
jgi:hypothetical protein